MVPRSFGAVDPEPLRYWIGLATLSDLHIEKAAGDCGFRRLLNTYRSDDCIVFLEEGDGYGREAMPDGPEDELLSRLEEQYFGPNMSEKREIAALPRLLKSVDLFVDVGAGLGQYSFFANQEMHQGVIYAIEADPLRFERLRELCEQWADSGANEIVPLNVALSDEVGTAAFFVTTENKSGGLFQFERPRGPQADWTELRVKTETLDSLFSRERDPDLVKMDVEGAEYRVLLGATDILRRGKARFLIEVHPWGDPTLGKRESDVFDLFASFGYDFERVHHHWLFAKSGSGPRRWLKNRMIHVILDQPLIRRNVRRLFRAAR
jgi:FkbM family methyltransferase